MSVHYDVEAAVENFKRSVGDLALPEGLPDHVYVQARHPEVSTEILRMLLTEANRGTHPMDVLSAFASIVVSNVVNIARPFPEHQRKIYSLFSNHVSTLLDQEIRGVRNLLVSEYADIPSEKGGHA